MGRMGEMKQWRAFTSPVIYGLEFVPFLIRQILINLEIVDSM